MSHPNADLNRHLSLQSMRNLLMREEYLRIYEWRLEIEQIIYRCVAPNMTASAVAMLRVATRQAIEAAEARADRRADNSRKV